MVDAGHTNIKVAIDFVKEAVSIAPVYYITGNHEASLSQYDELKTGLEMIGVIVLEDKAIQLEQDNETITLIGLSDPNYTVKGDMYGEVPAMVRTKLNNLADTESSCVCVQSISYSLLCRWFIAAVLPLDGKLEAALLHRADRKRCTECGGYFLPKSNRGKYCPDCAGRMKRIKAAQRKRKQRDKCHALGYSKPP